MRHPGKRAGLIARGQRLQDLGMLDVAGRLPAARFGELVDADVAGGPVGVGPQLPLQRVGRGRGHEPVVVGVSREPRAEVPGAGRAAHRGQQALGLLAGRRPEVADRHGQGERLQQDPAGVDVVELLRVEARDPSALVRLDLDQALLLQHPQHLPQRGAADAELPGQAHLGQLRAGRQGAVEDAFPQVGVHVRDRLPGFGKVHLVDVRDLHDTWPVTHSP